MTSATERFTTYVKSLVESGGLQIGEVGPAERLRSYIATSEVEQLISRDEAATSGVRLIHRRGLVALTQRPEFSRQGAREALLPVLERLAVEKVERKRAQEDTRHLREEDSAQLRIGSGWCTSFDRPFPRNLRYRKLRFAYRAPSFFLAEMAAGGFEVGYLRFDEELNTPVAAPASQPGR